MARNKNETEIDALKAALDAGRPEALYVFYGQERYLLEHYVSELRQLLGGGGLSGFNHKLFDGAALTADDLIAACDTLPVLAERTLVEVRDYDLFKQNEETREKLAALLSDLPDHICLVFIYGTAEFKPDGRQTLAAALKKRARIVEFGPQEQSRLVRWIKAHFKQAGKAIDTPTAEYLAYVTGGLMTALKTEIEKVAAYADGPAVTRGDIDAVVSPVPDAVSYKLTDCLAAGDYNGAAALLAELLAMREPPHKLLFSISLKLRQLLAARVCLDAGLDANRFMALAGIRYGFQGRSLLAAARKTTLSFCRAAVLSCGETALRLNSGGEAEGHLTELLIDLAGRAGRAAR